MAGTASTTLLQRFHALFHVQFCFFISQWCRPSVTSFFGLKMNRWMSLERLWKPCLVDNWACAFINKLWKFRYQLRQHFYGENRQQWAKERAKMPEVA